MIILIVIIEAFGDYMLSLYAIKGQLLSLVTGYGMYAIILFLFVESIRKMGLAWSNTSWDGWSNIATGLVAIFVLGEKPSMKEILGIFFVSAGLVLLGNKGTAKKGGE